MGTHLSFIRFKRGERRDSIAETLHRCLETNLEDVLT